MFIAKINGLNLLSKSNGTIPENEMLWLFLNLPYGFAKLIHFNLVVVSKPACSKNL